MTIAAMGAFNAVSTFGSVAGSAAGGASASSGQGGAGIGFNLLGAPGDPAGVAYAMLNNRRARKEQEKNNAVHRSFIEAQTAQLKYEKQLKEEEQRRQRRIRNLLYVGA